MKRITLIIFVLILLLQTLFSEEIDISTGKLIIKQNPKVQEGDVTIESADIYFESDELRFEHNTYKKEIDYLGQFVRYTYHLHKGWNYVTFPMFGKLAKGNIDTDPIFADPENGDYSLFQTSPCIDAGDPDTDWDEDDTPPDMGAIPAIPHNYDARELTEIWNWVSFPMLDTLTIGNMDAEKVLGPILENMEVCIGDTARVWWDFDHWQNDIGDFHSVDGYKIQMIEPDTLPIPGFLEDPSTVIFLEPEDWNWISYFLTYSQKPENAFPDTIWNEYLNCIKAQDWSMFKWNDIWFGEEGTLNYGELYVVECDDSCSFSWVQSGESEERYEKEETEYFTYEEKSDYEPVMIDTVYGDTTIVEIGVFEGDVCVGASKVKDYPVQILAYVYEDSIVGSKDGQSGGGPLTFQLYCNSGKGNAHNKVEMVKNVKVLDFETSTFVDKPIYLNADEFAIVRLGVQGENVVPDVKFALQQNFPNPFNPKTAIRYSIPKDSKVELKVYNIKGQLVKTLVNEKQKRGHYTVIWDGGNDKGKEVSSGVYFYRIKANKKTIVKKMVTIK